MRLLTTNLTFREIQPKLKELVDNLFKAVPAGVGSSSFLKPTKAQFRDIIEQGAKWCVEQGYGWEEDLETTEESGTMEGADNSKCSSKSIDRGVSQIGTLGSGNHYIEIQLVKKENIFDEKFAKLCGITEPDQIVVMFHCLPADAKILTEHGCWMKIKDLENKKINVKTFDEKSHKISNTEIEKFYKVKDKEMLFRIKTKSGREIKATEDHPFLTKEGLKIPSEMKIGERLAVMPFEGVEYEEPSDEIIVSEEDIRKIHNSDILVNELKSKGLLPLRMNAWQLPILAKLVGYVTGDGNVRKSGRGWRVFIAGDREDLLKIKEDTGKLGFDTSNIIKRKGGGTIESSNGRKMKIEGISHGIDCSSSAFALLLIALSTPAGKKTSKEFKVPAWVIKAPGWIQRLYIAGYFGAELTKPVLTKSARKYEYFERPASAVYKIEKLKGNGITFLSQISGILQNFGIKSRVAEERSAGRITKAGKTVKILLRISSDIENLIQFYSKINYEYCHRKTVESCHVMQYLEAKQELWSATAEKLKVGMKGVKFKPYQYNFTHPSFNDFIASKRLNPPTPVIWDEIESIERIENNEEYVYDIRVKNENHNFFADNFITGNCGSRGMGHQVATDYLNLFLDVMESKYKIKILDRELACAPFNSKEGQDYFSAMKCAVNMAFANRQVIAHRVREVFQKVFGRTPEEMNMHQIYDVCHNTAKIENHVIDGKQKKVLVHRKGATRSFGPGCKEIPAKYREHGQPVIIGGSMETGSYLLLGTKHAMEHTFGTTAHGSGRTMSRTEARRRFRGQQLQQDMLKRGIYIRCTGWSSLAEEAGASYKSIDEVVEAAHKAGISKPVVKLVPIGNVKG